MKSDVTVVIDYYRKWASWPVVAWGLQRNSADIAEVIISNDEMWSEAGRSAMKASLPGLDVTLLEHERRGFRQPLCIKKAVEAARTPLVLHIDADVVLSPGAVQRLADVAEEELLVMPALHDAFEDVTVGDFESMAGAYDERVVERREWREKHVHPDLYPNIRDGCWLCYKKDYDAMGGHDVEYKSYGLTDYDFGCRWMLEYGPDSFMYMSDIVTYHIGGVDSPEDKLAKVLSEDNKARFAKTLARFKKEVLS